MGIIMEDKRQQELVEKYEQKGLLEGVQVEDKIKLSQLYEDFTNYLINIGEENLVWGKCHFEVLYIHLIMKLYTEFNETNYSSVYHTFKKWYDEEGVNLDVGGDHMVSNQITYLTEFIKYYKELKVYMDDSLKNKVLEYTLYDNLNGGIAKPEYKFTVLIKTLNFENKNGDEIKLITDDVELLLNHEHCYVTMFAIGKLNGEVFSVEETKDGFDDLRTHLSNNKKIVIYSANVNNGKIVYRYSLLKGND